MIASANAASALENAHKLEPSVESDKGDMFRIETAVDTLKILLSKVAVINS